MLRFMLSPIVGNGTVLNQYRAAVADVQVNVSAVIPTHTSGENLGHPKFRFALCLVATTSISAIQGVTNSYVFPDYNLDGRMDGMEAEVRTGMLQSVQAYDIDGNGLHFDATHNDADSYRSVIAKIGKQLEPIFEVDQMSCAEVSQ
jgi:hypothetical protein